MFSVEAQKNHSTMHAMTTDQLFKLSNVSVRFGSIHALSKINLEISQNEMLLVTGASGAGKTTLLRVLGNEVLGDEGEISLPRSGQFVTKIFQDLRLLPNLNLEDNLQLCYDPKIYQSSDEFYSDLLELSKILGVYEHLSHNVLEANRGLLQKTAIIRALLSRPDILLADEPTCSLDKGNSLKIYELLSFYNHRKNLTIVWATHNKDLVKNFSGRNVHLDKGRLLHSGHACFI